MESGQILDASAALRFMFAGKAHVTLVSRKTGTRFTYRVSAKKGSDSLHFVSLLTGRENTRDYEFFGTVFDRQTFRHSARSSLGQHLPSTKAFGWTVAALQAGRVPETVEVWHEGRCGRCGRLLTVPSSIATGFGPECAGLI